jgi:hypothetical protein
MIGMKRVFIAALLFVLVLQAGCSFRFLYVVVNSSKDPITVGYRFKKLPDTEEMKKNGLNDPDYFFFFIEPKLKRQEDLEENSVTWRTASEGQVVRNAANGEMKITIQPREVLQVYSDDGHAISHKNGAKGFPIAYISLAGSKGQMSFEGDLIIEQFSELGGRIYQIRYE